MRNNFFIIFSGRGRVMRVKPGEKFVTGSYFRKTAKNNMMIFYTKLKPIRTGWSWSSGSEDLETGVSPRGPVLDFSREIKMPSFEVLASFVFIRLKFLSQLKASSPLTGSLGARMMEKMGWKDGEGLGRFKSGDVNPLTLDIKFDKKGLMAAEETKKGKEVVTMTACKDLSGIC